MSEFSKEITALMEDIGQRAREAAMQLARSSEAQRYDALGAAASAIFARRDEILDANARDMQAAETKGLTGSRRCPKEFTR
jgi:glutamate-5-semialdehyde dehydrogenase